MVPKLCGFLIITKCCTFTSFTNTVTAAQEVRFLPLLVEDHRLCADHTVKRLRTCLGLSWFSLVLTPAPEPTDCCLSCLVSALGIAPTVRVWHWDNHGVTNNSLLCPSGLGKLVNSAKEINCDKETYKYSSKQAWDLGWENPHHKHHHSPGKDFQMLMTCSNTQVLLEEDWNHWSQDPDRHCGGNHNNRDKS